MLTLFPFSVRIGFSRCVLGGFLGLWLVLELVVDLLVILVSCGVGIIPVFCCLFG